MSLKLTTLDHLKELALKSHTEVATVKTALEAKIPAKVSQLQNDSGFQTSSDVVTLIQQSGKLSYVKVSGISDINVTAPDAASKIYLVPIATEDASENNGYDEYMVVDGNLERIDGTKIDLTGYLQESDIATDSEVTTALNAIFTA